MTHLSSHINGIPRDHYGLWCIHGLQLMVPDPEDTSDYPNTIPADPWPCDDPECTYASVIAEQEEEAQKYEEERWREFRDMTT